MRYINEENTKIASRYLFISMAIIIIRQDIKYHDEGPYKIKEIYLQMLSEMEREAVRERKQIIRRMRINQLSVLPLTKDDSFSNFLFICQGKEEKKSYFNPAIRKKVEKVLKELMFKSLYRLQNEEASSNV
ncbi:MULTISPECIES: hypothetical protein [Oceanobacillus]|uniref:Uncharacterized protein n=1 Tax=Oceanobacillus kimchii TaxID=746691 RepID=A0ABQ5TM56_9BACI|nr:MULTISPECIES: hypothetical protein [Oceanobacillus]MBT2599066.1 hypothetical protein [Oceanobacillus sp. ISL-74]MBT2651984.1 hypothetical protein [Oceanobacillus sp. ISL-73]MCT1578679.1 hypothetical protein [Oceanobacillus kimchii]MCT2136272.1 hypothetical protein [Oceanobacillus kimchii]GLO65622.1 hypothetical protein MACH08_14060 [Oceanobacillus kimchii]